MHSVTKYMVGILILLLGFWWWDADLAHQLKFIQMLPEQFVALWIAFWHWGIKTLHVRMQRHCENTR